MKKLLIMMLLASMVFMISGCGKDKDADATSDALQQEQQQQGEAEQSESAKPESKYTAETAKEVTSVDVNNMTSEDMDKLVNMFNSEDSTEDEKEAARIQLEALFKQAEAQQ